MSYNGWANYETWRVNLWLSDIDKSSYFAARAVAHDAHDENDAAERFKEFVQDMMPEAVNGTMYADLISAALSEVDWLEIARAFREDMEDSDDEDEEDSDE